MQNKFATYSQMGVIGILLIASLGASTYAIADDYFVRKSGNDSNNGKSPDNAFLTIDRAANLLRAGDTVYVGAGTYNETVSPQNDGTAGSPIRIIADSDGAKTGDPGVVIVSRSGGKSFEIRNDNYIEIYGFTMTGSRDGIRWESSRGGVMEACTIVDNTDEGIEVKDADVQIRNCTIASNADNAVYLLDDVAVTITDTAIFGNGDEGIFAWASDVELSVRRCVISDNGDSGISLNGTKAEVINTLIHHNFDDGINLGNNRNNYISITHCTVVYNGNDGISNDRGTVSVWNTISAFNDDDGFDRNRDSWQHGYNLCFGNNSVDFEGVTQQSSELSVDPKFAGTLDFRLLASSPAIDSASAEAATTTIDLNSVDRPIGDGWDMGCYEGVVKLLFTDVSSDKNFIHTTTTSSGFGSGWHWADYDNDGDLDAIATGSSARYFENEKSGDSFSGTAFFGSTRRQGGMTDIDNDGDIDFWAANHGSYHIENLFLNLGDGSFFDNGDIGFNQPSNNEPVVIADVDHDGREDVIMPAGNNGNWIGFNKAGTPASLDGTADRKYGLNDSGDYGNGDFASSGDVNNDGYLDFFYHYRNGKLFLSNGDGTYTEDDSGINVVTGNNDKVGSAFGDYDNDGDLDLFVPRYDLNQPGYLLRNDYGKFVNVTSVAGITDESRQRSACWGDYDNDGWLDLYITTESGPNLLYQNNGMGGFRLVNEGTEASGDGHDAVFVDFDNDGDLDIAVALEDESVVLLENGTDDKNYLKVRAIGGGTGGTSVSAIGTRIDMIDGSGAVIGMREIGVARGFGGTEPMWVHFGGIDPDETYVVRVHFVSGIKEVKMIPSETSTKFDQGEILQMLTVTEDVSSRKLVHWEEVSPGDE